MGAEVSTTKWVELVVNKLWYNQDIKKNQFFCFQNKPNKNRISMTFPKVTYDIYRRAAKRY